MPFGHTRAQQGDDFPVRLRFANLPAAGGGGPSGQGKRDAYQAPAPRKVLERGLTTADLKARVALKAKASVRPPDLDKLGEKQPAKQARAGTNLSPRPPQLPSPATARFLCLPRVSHFWRCGGGRVGMGGIWGGALGENDGCAHEERASMGCA